VGSLGLLRGGWPGPWGPSPPAGGGARCWRSERNSRSCSRSHLATLLSAPIAGGVSASLTRAAGGRARWERLGQAGSGRSGVRGALQPPQPQDPAARRPNLNTPGRTQASSESPLTEPLHRPADPKGGRPAPAAAADPGPAGPGPRGPPALVPLTRTGPARRGADARARASGRDQSRPHWGRREGRGREKGGGCPGGLRCAAGAGDGGALMALDVWARPPEGCLRPGRAGPAGVVLSHKC
jgi:hypothetical protein